MLVPTTHLMRGKLFIFVFCLLLVNLPAVPAWAVYEPGTGRHDQKEAVIKQILRGVGLMYGWDKRACFHSIMKYSTMDGIKKRKLSHCPKIVGPNKIFDITKKDLQGNLLEMDASRYLLTLDVTSRGIQNGGTLPEGTLAIQTTPVSITAYWTEAGAVQTMKEIAQQISAIAKLGKGSKITNFHGFKAVYTPYGFQWRAGRFMFEIYPHKGREFQGTIVDVDHMKVAETVFSLVLSSGLLTGQDVLLQD